MAFKDEILEFTDTTIINDSNGQVMMSWETPRMEKAAEYISHNKETDEPLIRKAIKYRWSSKDGQKIAYKEDYNQPLSKEDMKDYMQKKEQFDSASTPEETDDLPF